MKSMKNLHMTALSTMHISYTCTGKNQWPSLLMAIVLVCNHSSSVFFIVGKKCAHGICTLKIEITLPSSLLSFGGHEIGRSWQYKHFAAVAILSFQDCPPLLVLY